MFITAATLFWPTIPLRSPRPCSCCCEIRNCVAATKKPPPRPPPATTGQRSASASVQSCSRWRKRNRLRYAPFPGAGRKEKPKNREKEEFLAIGDHGTNTNLATAEVTGRRLSVRMGDPTRNAFFWLSAFFVVYCARPEDWVPGLRYAPLAKITAILAMWGLFNSQGRMKRTFKDVPKEGKLLLTMIGLLVVSSLLSPIWKGGSLSKTLDFSKVYVAWVLTFLLITTF